MELSILFICLINIVAQNQSAAKRTLDAANVTYEKMKEIAITIRSNDSEETDF